MTLQLCCCFSPSLPRPASHHHCCFLFPTKNSRSSSFSRFHLSKNLVAAAENSVSSSEGVKLVSELLDDELLDRVSAAKDAGEVLALIAAESRKNGGVVSASDCHLILSAAVDRGNAELALSVFSSMRSSFDSDIILRGNMVMGFV